VNHRTRSIFALLWFLPGAIIGLLLGSVIDLGIAATIHKTSVAPLGALTFFVGFSVCCFACTCLWRLPRRYLVGRYHATAIAALSSGTILACGFYLTVEGLENLGPLRADGSPSGAQWWVVAAIGLGFAFAAVELEAMLTRLTSKERPATLEDGEPSDAHGVADSANTDGNP
jgi:hypothetical protein